MAQHEIWTVKYAPRSINELIAPRRIKQILKGYSKDAKNGAVIPNFTLSSLQPGVGKTTAARVLFDEAGYEILIFDGSKAGDRGISGMSEKVEPFALGASISGAPRVIIIDEADNLTKDAQLALRGIINRAAETGSVTFVLTCNYVSNILEPILSRCPVIDFRYEDKDDINEAIKQTIKRLFAIIKSEQKAGILEDKAKVSTIVEITKNLFPDLRRIFTEVQTFVYTGKTRETVNTFAGGCHEKLVSALFDKDFNSIIKIVEENRLGSKAVSTIKMIVEYGMKNDDIVSGAWGWIVLPLAAKYLDMINNSVDPNIALSAFLVELSDKIEENREYLYGNQ